jgi:hypothetical protein
MLAILPKVLADLIVSFAFDANEREVAEALAYLLFMKELQLHPATLNEGVFDYSFCEHSMYNRATQTNFGYFAPWNCQKVDTPFRSFFVWWSKRDLFNRERMKSVISDLDFRMVSFLFRDFPVKRCRHYKLRILEFIDHCPEQAAIALSPIFREIKYEQLLLDPTTMGRFIVSVHCSRVPNWTKYAIMHL